MEKEHKQNGKPTGTPCPEQSVLLSVGLSAVTGSPEYLRGQQKTKDGVRRQNANADPCQKLSCPGTDAQQHKTAHQPMKQTDEKQQNGENGEEISEADQQMIQAILEGLPLKSLSIAGVTGETIEGIIYKLNELC